LRLLSECSASSIRRKARRQRPIYALAHARSNNTSQPVGHCCLVVSKPFVNGPQCCMTMMLVVTLGRTRSRARGYHPQFSSAPVHHCSIVRIGPESMRRRPAPHDASSDISHEGAGEAAKVRHKTSTLNIEKGDNGLSYYSNSEK
jgi:hypothetical protein